MAVLKYNMVIGVDPGVTTGISILDIEYGTWVIGQEYRRFDLDDQVDHLLHANFRRKVLLVTEMFIITPQTGKMSQQPASLKVNGMLEHLAHKYQVAYDEQSQSTAKKMTKDPWLREMKLYVTGRGHANDATRHVRLACERFYLPFINYETSGYNNIKIEVTKN